MHPEKKPQQFEPKIVAFVCTWCTYAGADLAGTSRMQYPSNVRVVKFPCTGRIDPLFILRAFQKGADGVLVSGCHPGDCHYMAGNFHARRRFAAFRQLLDFVGVDLAAPALLLGLGGRGGEMGRGRHRPHRSGAEAWDRCRSSRRWRSRSTGRASSTPRNYKNRTTPSRRGDPCVALGEAPPRPYKDINMTETNQHKPLVDPRCWDDTTAALRAAAAKLLTDGTVAAVVGYVAGRRAGSAMPAIITTAAEAAEAGLLPGLHQQPQPST